MFTTYINIITCLQNMHEHRMPLKKVYYNAIVNEKGSFMIWFHAMIVIMREIISRTPIR